MKSEFQITSESLKELKNKVETNINQMGQKLVSFDNHISYNDKLLKFDGIFSEITDKISSTKTIIEKGIENFQPPQQQDQPFPKQNVMDIIDRPSEIKIQSNDNNNFYNNNNNNNNSNYNNNNIVHPTDKLGQFKDYNPEYEYIVSLKQKSNEIVIFDTKSRMFKNAKITPSNFIDNSNVFTNFQDNSRHVNLGTSILITGGYKDRQAAPNCYLMLLSKKNHLSNEYEINVMSYPNMIEGRERHNIIHLKDKDSVVVCSGFFNQNAEITNMNSQNWKSLPKMNEIRANAALSYINQRYIYCFSGFKINEVKVGQYLNSAEILDLNNLNAGWTLVNFNNMDINLKLSAMGVVYLSDKTILLCGGYDGSQYKNNVYRVETKDNGSTISKVDKFESTLPGNYIFFHSAFLRSENICYNYDLQLNLVAFNPMATENAFKVQITYLNFK